MSRVTEHEDAQQMYGLDAAEWLARWDNGDTVYTVEMGGIGPGYEQCIQIAAAEIIRVFISENMDHRTWGHAEEWERDRDHVNDAIHKTEGVVSKLGLSGSQWGAAMSLATQFYIRDPWVVLTDDRIRDRIIQTRKEMPGG